MTATFTPTNEPFLKHLAVQKTPYLLVTAETDDFDDLVLDAWQAEGFAVTYVGLGEGGAEYTRRLHSIANDTVGVSDQYAIVAYGDAATECLEAHIKSTPRLCALVAYYPAAIPDPPKTRFPMQTSVLVHLVGADIGVNRTPEVLGIQGKRKTIRKRIDPGLGVGGELKLSYPTYKYEGVESGFAEHDLDEFDAVAESIAWTRSLTTIKRAFGMSTDIERLRDQHLVNTDRDTSKAMKMVSNDARVIFGPTMTGGVGEEELERFYGDYFTPSPLLLGTRLLSRTIGVDRVVDELHLSFTHDQEIDWLLPGIGPTKKKIEIVLVSIVTVKAGKLASEHVYWDQASVLVQVGLLDPKNVPQKYSKIGVDRLPVSGAESARAVVHAKAKSLNGLIPDW